ncbi:virulence protein RhuM/Fic/DOC family protein [Algibacter sp. 2305UL17-15]|uniref:virulence protein RhuM/Fic/DOC family protein n=1 Tax=Algibacter sp. 2305UL17-15 TaxID=3231268 RepID=UPI00345797FB
MSAIVIYKKENEIQVEVTYENDSLWLSLNQISELFDRDKSVISRHIRNIYKEKELPEYATVAKNATVQKEGKREVMRQIDYYNLDVILAVGYRVSSAKGTQFRIWANKILKEHLIKGYTQNELRLNQLKKTIQLVQRTSKAIKNQDIGVDGFIDVLTDYSQALDILDDYDHQRITKNVSSEKVIFHIDYNEAISAIKRLRDKFGASLLFGNEKDESFKSSIAVIDQTFNGNDLYPSIEEKAANLLYLVVKNHSFTDGNKRIAAWLFIWYLDKNQFLYKSDASKKITNSTLVALTLMIAESNPKEKDLIINIIINLINSENE